MAPLPNLRILACASTLAWMACPAQVSVFSNTAVAGCNAWDSGNNYTGFQRAITVSGLPVPMTTVGTVLRQVNLRMGSPACRGDLSTYSARLLSPQGTIIQLFDTFTVATTPQWFDIKYRAGNVQGDAPFLYPVKWYPESVQEAYHPWSIGYYRTELGDLSALNGEDPNGTWTLQLAENTAEEVSFEQVDLLFGPPIERTLVNTGLNSPLDSCAGATCLDGSAVLEMSLQTPAFQAPDPLYPGDVVNGCAWNGGNDLSAWFRLTAAGTTARITVSKLVGSATSCPDDHRVQLLVVEADAPLCSSAPLVVPTGGCPDPAAPGDNNAVYAYPTGGVPNIADVYDAGISANCEFNLSGLTPGGNYHLLVDVCGPADALRPYIELEEGGVSCNFQLPVSWTGFNVSCVGGVRRVSWSVATQTDNVRFEVERSTDAVAWTPVGSLPGAGTTQQAMSYELLDPLTGVQNAAAVQYYRVKSIDSNGMAGIAGIQASTCGFAIYPNPVRDFLSASLPVVNADVEVIDPAGRVVRRVRSNGALVRVDVTDLATGYYTLRVLSSGEVLNSGVFVKF